MRAQCPVERVRRLMQNQHVGLDYEWGTDQQRAAHRDQEEQGYRAALARANGRAWL